MNPEGYRAFEPLKADAENLHDVAFYLHMLRELMKLQSEYALEMCRKCGVTTP